MSDKIEIPIDTAQLVLARKNAGMRKSSVSIGRDGELLPNGNENTEYTVIVRSNRSNRSSKGSNEPSPKAVNLKSCKGLKGCEFAKCAEKALGKLPRHLQGLCPTNFTGPHTE
jgi:hypothetical protein